MGCEGGQLRKEQGLVSTADAVQGAQCPKKVTRGGSEGLLLDSPVLLPLGSVCGPQSPLECMGVNEWVGSPMKSRGESVEKDWPDQEETQGALPL